jgi:tetratricopeptide (TPR) repeat protein
VTLEPLDDAATESLISLLLGGAEVPDVAVQRIVDAAEGNPLFVGEMLRMMIDDDVLVKDGSGWTTTGDIESVPMPGSIQALVAARLDRLEGEERQVIGRGSVIGRIFWWGAMSRLTPENLRSGLASHLQTLVRRELIAPERSTFPGEDAFRFASVLVSDAAYQGLSKKLRADLHESFTAWLEAKAGDRLRELEEIFGYHLEQSFLYRRELGISDDRTREIGARAAELLASAGRRALGRADMPAASNLLERAATLEPREARRVELLLDLFAAVMETSELGDAKKVLDEAAALAGSVADAGLSARVDVQRYVVMYSEGEEGWREKALEGVDRAIATFKELDDPLGLTQALQVLADIYWAESKYGRVERILEEALAHAQRAGNQREEAKILGWLPYVAIWGPTHTDKALALCDVVTKLADGNRMVEAKVLLSRAGLNAMKAEFEDARKLVVRSKDMFEELGLGFTRAAATQVSGMIEMLADDPAAAEAEFREGYEALEKMGDNNFLPSVAAFLAEALYAQERYDEAEGFVAKSRELFAVDDETAKADWGPVQAKLWARAGRTDEAIKLAAEAVEVLAPTDEISDLADSLMDLSEVLKLSGHDGPSAEAAQRALELYEKKGILCAADRARARVSAAG